MSKRSRGLILLAIGVVLAIVGLAADELGLGGYPGIGKKQTVALIVGVGLFVVGVLQLRSSA